MRDCLNDLYTQRLKFCLVFVFCQSFASGVEESEGFICSIKVIFILIPSS